MPWRETTVSRERQEFLTLARQPDRNISRLCRQFGISRKTAYKWLKRDSTQEQSRRPHNSPKQTGSRTEQQVLAVRDEHPAWGGRKIARILQHKHGIHIAPSTITSILHRNGRIIHENTHAAHNWQRFEHPYPNALWQMDFKGHFATDGGRCHPLTVIDDRSRYNIILRALANERREGVQAALTEAFRQYGLPDRINTDNGTPWGDSAQGGLTRLAAWLIRLGIRPGRSRPLHPQTNGKDERFHRSLKAEVLKGRTFGGLMQAQQAFDSWRHCYNHERPHEALGLDTPSQHYRSSPREFPEHLSPIEYPPGDLVRKTDINGHISLLGRQVRIGKGLVGQTVACRPVPSEDGVYEVYFCFYRLGRIDLNDFC